MSGQNQKTKRTAVWSHPSGGFCTSGRWPSHAKTKCNALSAHKTSSVHDPFRYTQLSQWSDIIISYKSLRSIVSLHKLIFSALAWRKTRDKWDWSTDTINQLVLFWFSLYQDFASSSVSGNIRQAMTSQFRIYFWMTLQSPVWFPPTIRQVQWHPMNGDNFGMFLAKSIGRRRTFKWCANLREMDL